MGKVLAALALVAFAGLAMAGPTTDLLSFTPSERAQIRSMGPWPPAIQIDRSNRVDGSALAIRFGAELFADSRLSRDGRLSCRRCHDPGRALQDGLTAAVGIAPGIRNTPTLFDVAWQRWLGWDGGHDSLWWASLAPLLDPREMGHDLASLGARFRSVPDWGASYRDIFGQPVPANDQQLSVDIAKILAAYQATLVSPRTPFDDFRDALERNDLTAAAAYPRDAQRGLRLFIGQGSCTSCHAGANFTNGEFADIGIGFFVPGGVDSGRHGGLKALIKSPLNRLGPFNDALALDPRAVLTRHVYLDHRHFGQFRVPGLRQLMHTAPYMHNGSLATLEAVVRHYNEIDLERLHADGVRILRPLGLGRDEVSDLVAFLRSLSSPALGD